MRGFTTTTRVLVLLATLSETLCATARAQGGEAAFFATPDQIALHAHGWALDFRYRQMQMRDEGESPAPRLVVDGIAHLRFEAGGVWTDEVYVELLDSEQHRSTPRRARTHHSLTSGMYARAFSIAGAPTDSALVEPWSGLPPLAFYGLGFVDGVSVLRRAEITARERVSEGVERVRYRTPEGKRWSLDYTTQQPGAMQRLEGQPSDDSWTDWIFFEAHVEGPPGLPLRPTRVSSMRVSTGGLVSHVSVWQAVERLDPPGAPDFVLASQTAVSDFRFESSSNASRALDRQLALDELPSWAGALATPHDDAAVDLDRDALAALERSPARSNSSLAMVGWAAAVVGLALGAAAVRGRKLS